VKFSASAILAASLLLLTAGAAHGQENLEDNGVGAANPNSSLQPLIGNSSGSQFDWRDSSLITDPIGSQAIFAENFDPGASGSSAEQPLLVSSPAPTADAASQSTTTTTASATSDSDFHLSVSGYLWLPGVHGNVGALGRTVAVSASPGDLLSNFRFGIMGFIEPSYKRIIFPVDLMWIRLEDDKAIPFPNLEVNNANIKGGELILTPKIGYRIVDREKLKIDALTGFRYWHFSENLKFTPSNLNLNFSSSQNWVDPLVGGRITVPLSPKVAVTIAGDVGGWGVGSQLDYQAVGLLGYRIKPALTLQAGFRYLDVDYTSAGTVINLATSGVMFGITLNLK
jgi:hypothetical protein